MRQFFFFLIFFLGLFWVVDVVAFEGRNSADCWQEAKIVGNKMYYQIGSKMYDQIGQIWR
jgi:hypothetical protein